MKKLILASRSAGRKQVLENAGFDFQIIPSDYEEDMTLPFSPRELAVYLSKGKAKDVAGRVKEGIVIAADTFVVLGGKFLGKPKTPAEAKKMLGQLSGKVHSMVTGLTVIDVGHKEISKSDESKIWFRKIKPEEIEQIIKTGESFTKAGGYAYQGYGGRFVEKIEGSESNILGMPLEILKDILEELS